MPDKVFWFCAGINLGVALAQFFHAVGKINASRKPASPPVPPKKFQPQLVYCRATYPALDSEP